MRRYMWCLLLAAILICAAAGQASAQERIRVSGIVPFTYNNHAYVPVRPTCDYLRADLFWDPYANSATVFYRNRNLTLVVGTTQAYYGNEIVALPAPVVVVRDQLCCPAVAFNRYLDVGLRWEPSHHRAFFEGPPGWGYYDVDPICPPYALGAFASYGYVPAYQPTPFIYGGAAYLPLRSVADLIGAALLFDLFNDRCVATYGGVQTVLFIGSPRCYYGDRVIVLPAAPIVCNNIVYVPAPLIENYWRVPVRRERGIFGMRGDRGWHDFNFNPAPPAPIYRSMSRAPLLRTAASGLRSVGMTVPVEPGLLSLAAHGPAARRAGGAVAAAPLRAAARARRGPGTGFPALAAAPPRAGVSVLGPSAQRRARAGAPAAAAAPPRGGRAPQAGPAAMPRGGGKQKGGAVAAPPVRGKPKAGPAATHRGRGGGPQGGAVSAPRGGGKQKGGAVAAPPVRGKPKAGPAATPRGRGGGPQGGAVAPPRGAVKSKGGAAAAPPSGGRGRPQGGPAAAPRGRGGGAQGATPAPPSGGRSRGGAAAAPPSGGRGRSQGGPAAAPRGGGKAKGGAAAAPRGGGKAGGPQGQGGQPKDSRGQGQRGG